MDCSLTGSSVHGVLSFQKRILEWVASSYSRDLSDLEIKVESLASPASASIKLFQASSSQLKVK